MYPELGKLYYLAAVLFQLCILSTIETETSTYLDYFLFHWDGEERDEWGAGLEEEMMIVWI